MGLASGLILSRTLGGLLYQTPTTDPLTLLATVVTLGGVATLAIYLPARRASRLNPLVALHAD